MVRHSVSSSNLHSMGYSTINMVLEIEFNTGAVYQYFNVPANIYQALMSASSHGRYFDAYIKYTYRYVRVR